MHPALTYGEIVSWNYYY